MQLLFTVLCNQDILYTPFHCPPTHLSQNSPHISLAEKYHTRLCFIPGFPPYLENLENLELCHFLFQTWKMPGICSKSGANLKFANFMFQASLFKMSFTEINLIYFIISTLSTQTLIQSQIDLGLHCFYLKITWKLHGILNHKRRGNPASALTHFKSFITKICMKVPGIWNKKPWKKLEFGIWKKSGYPV